MRPLDTLFGPRAALLCGLGDATVFFSVAEVGQEATGEPAGRQKQPLHWRQHGVWAVQVRADGRCGGCEAGELNTAGGPRRPRAEAAPPGPPVPQAS